MGKKNFKFNRHQGNAQNNFRDQQIKHKNRINKPSKPEPINHAIKGPLFDKSKLSCTWNFNRKIGPGFMNGQNTCFLNSVLECLTYTPALAQQLLKQEHSATCRIEGFCALCSMERHMVRCLKDEKSFSKGAAILPRYFTSNLRAISKTLRLGRQEDAHEFYMFLLSAIQKASIHGLGKLPPKVEETALVYQVFGGKLRSQVRCFSCKATSNSYEACLDLSVDLNNKANTLQMALDNFIKTDVIGNDADNRYKCDSCKQMVRAGKQMTIDELPMMLTVHLKRFAFDLHRGYMRKITTDVQFPELLNMAPYVSPEKSIKQADYQLYAVLVHYGHGCDSGHYIAYVKAPNGQWYLMDDDAVTPVSLKEVLSQRAYMLFYQQLKPQTKQPESPPVLLKKEVAAKKVLVVQKEEDKPKKRVNIVEPRVESDNPRAWTVQSSERPRRSLRGNLSPPTFGSHVNDDSVWAIQSYQEFKRKQKITNRRVFRVKLEAKKTPWLVVPHRK
ncbi:Ubiquitin carboxyl-terminal hydrolase 36 [Choanephora cucurbitarum]|uniref:ubiquitinyl hydrolase 1 n=1 Tax=Choanephora cucurbitarum TaxID=101091 RepID=A0A1C7NIN8_9FUNG|nr:Ubiquitin carboxyl-terminal hydrolase 36 [Choanephora cucurbitarum]